MSHIQFLGTWPTAAALAVSGLLAAAAFWLYRRQLRHSELGATAWLLPTLRGLAVAIIALTLAEPAIQSRTKDGDLARITFLLDASQSMSITSGQFDFPNPSTSGPSPQPTRFDRGTALLDGANGILSALQSEFDVRVVRFDRQAGAEIWNSRGGLAADSQYLTYDWSPAVWGEATAIGEALSPFTSATDPKASASSQAEKSIGTNPPSSFATGDAVVLFSDGLSNHGQDPLAVAKQLDERGVRVFALGFGPFEAARDVGVRQLTLPERLYRTDTLSGTVIISQHQAQGTPFQLQLEQQGQIVWQTNLIAGAEPQREIPFSLPVAPLFNRVASQLPPGTQVANLPLKLSAKLVVEAGETYELNNAVDSYTLVASQKSRLLLLDGRSRWETRYLKNMFSRDPSWQVDTIIMAHAFESKQSTPDSLPGKSQEGKTPAGKSRAGATPRSVSSRLPATQAEMFEFDLVILGEVEAFLLPAEFLQWLREYVEVAGGGLIVIDGAREHLRDSRFESLQRLFPVRWLTNTRPREPSSRVALTRSPQLTAIGQSLEALQLSATGANTSEQIWSKLPPLEYVTHVEPLPGAEVLLEAVNEIDRIPLLITRRYGAGRVLFSASDETWRWRYEMAERLHSRLWLQLARWTMKTPLSLHSEYVSLDTGAANYRLGQPVNVRCQLRTAAGEPASGLAASAIVSSEGQTVSIWPLTEENVAGTYTALIANLPPGDYQLRVAAPNFSTQALRLEASFSVLAPPNQEMQHLACDEAALAALASQTGGKYLRESQAVELIELLQPLVRGKIRTSTLLLWQSYWWFTAAMLLLIAEWIVRKRVGLV